MWIVSVYIKTKNQNYTFLNYNGISLLKFVTHSHDKIRSLESYYNINYINRIIKKYYPELKWIISDKERFFKKFSVTLKVYT